MTDIRSDRRRRNAITCRKQFILSVSVMSFLWFRSNISSMGVLPPPPPATIVGGCTKNSRCPDGSTVVREIDRRCDFAPCTKNYVEQHATTTDAVEDVTAQSCMTETSSPQDNDENNTQRSLTNCTLAVISACIPGARFNSKYIDASLSNKQYFCDKWGAECILSRERLHSENKNYSPKWEKIFLINRTMHTSHADWFIWLDCDAAFTNFDIDWITHLHSYLDRTKVLIASKDKNGINLGVFLVPNTPSSKLFIEKMWDERHNVERRGHFHKDQSALQFLLKTSPQLSQSINGNVPQEKINSYLLLNNPDGNKEWTPNDWIVHQVFCELMICPTRFLSVLQSVEQRL